MKYSGISTWPTDKISHIVLFVLVGVISVMFGLFYIVGYDNPYDENPDFNAPALSGMLVWFVIIFVLVTFVSCVVAMLSACYRHERKHGIVNGINRSKILYFVILSVVFLLLVTFLNGSSSWMMINGELFRDIFWLKAADMFIETSFVMIALSLSAIIFDSVRSSKRRR